MRDHLRKKMFFWILLISILLIIFNYNRILSPLEGLFFNVTEKNRSSAYKSSANMNSYFYFIFHYPSIKAYIKDLEDQFSKRVVDYSKLHQLEEENANLKKEINYTKSTKYKFVTGEVVSAFDMSSANIVRINIGRKDGVISDAPVLYGEGIMIGTIINVDENFSDVLLLSDKNSLITVSSQSQEKIVGVLKGNLANAMEINYIPLDFKIEEGDLIISSGYEETIPRGLVVGQVKDFYFTEGGYFKTATISSIVDFNSLDYLNVIIQK